MKLIEVKNNPEILAQLRWDLTPQNSMVTNTSDGTMYIVEKQEDFDKLNQLLTEKKGYYFYVDVWNCQARLGLAYNDGGGGGKMEIINDFESPLLEKAVYQAGGSITTSGWYPLSKQLVTLLKRKFGVEQ
jgi:hypothetical protein